jgi:hypothetical protein
MDSHPHFTAEETKAQERDVTYLNSTYVSGTARPTTRSPGFSQFHGL